MSLKIEEYVNLKALNTLGLESVARYFVRVESLVVLREALAFARERNLPVIPLGEGSNVVLSECLDALVLLIRLKGRVVVESQNDSVLLKVGAGEHWHSLVCWSLEQGFYGLENLALIPGCVGAAPVQNIGAYGVELKDRFVSLEAIDRQTGEIMTLSAEDCAFGYRDSVFKSRLLDQVVITSVTLRLSKTLMPELDYGALREKAEVLACERGQPTGMDICHAVCDIRREKLPDPKVIGNAGSFFKNPVVSDEHKAALKEKFAELPAYQVSDGWKLAAGWLIEQCGFKGCVKTDGAGVYEKQALVLVNHGNACGKAILKLAGEIQATVKERFSVNLEIEPRIY
ncbi:UDP-N-acetylmuramate dehydrogenase [Kistimonas scapharcae]|uniref:UDP-N-acetylenolpyruvoylglucosamine reductase n=1 Tax=Kistimonas scapharcae TaxID=1036133 RepID=A0ABP8VBM0_9GAMM